jgi:DNA-directed RNA polymerase subunit F
VIRHAYFRLSGGHRALAILGALSLAGAQIPRVHDIDLYGTGKVSAARILREAKLQPGEPLPASKGDLEDRINEISGISRVRVEAVCCEGPDAILFVGVEEKDGPRVAFRSEPTGKAVLPADLTGDYQQFLGAVRQAVAQTHAGGSEQEKLSTTRSARRYEEKFASFTGEHLTELRDVLHNSEDSEQRAIAAAVIGYAPKKAEVIGDLQLALQDPDESVRSNAMRSIKALVAAGSRDQTLAVHISPTWLIELLNSLVLSDRLQAADILVALTDRHDAVVLDQIRTRALTSLAEMARWETLRYALPPFLLVGRMAGLNEQEIQRRWSNGERETVIQKALARPPRRK